MRPPESNLEQRVSSRLVVLIEELLDAHLDTIELGNGLRDRLGVDEVWRVHVDYLQALQRHGSAAMADVTR